MLCALCQQLIKNANTCIHYVYFNLFFKLEVSTYQWRVSQNKHQRRGEEIFSYHLMSSLTWFLSIEMREPSPMTTKGLMWQLFFNINVEGYFKPLYHYFFNLLMMSLFCHNYVRKLRENYDWMHVCYTCLQVINFD